MRIHHLLTIGYFLVSTALALQPGESPTLIQPSGSEINETRSVWIDIWHIAGDDSLTLD